MSNSTHVDRYSIWANEIRKNLRRAKAHQVAGRHDATRLHIVVARDIQGRIGMGDQEFLEMLDAVAQAK